MNKIWLISDTHFNHPDIITKFEFRPQNYQDQIIRKIKNNIQEWDILIHLWDVIFDRPSELNEILNKMWNNFTKILVRWNHDQSWVNFYLNKGFNMVLDEFMIKDYMWYNIIFSHIPKKDWELPEWFINIHGHLHTNSHHVEEYTKHLENYILYSAEKENYMPILLNNVLKKHKELNKK